MNILTEKLPEEILVHGQAFPIFSDFRTCLTIILAFEDPELALIEKQMILLDNLYKEKPSDLTEATIKAIEFLNGGVPSESAEGPRLYSFEKDSSFIYAAFQQTHGINLSQVSLHWWEFLALFMDLGSETTFSGLVSLRRKLKTGRATKEEREAAREMGSLITLPELDHRTVEEREQEQEFLTRWKNRKQTWPKETMTERSASTLE